MSADAVGMIGHGPERMDDVWVNHMAGMTVGVI